MFRFKVGDYEKVRAALAAIAEAKAAAKKDKL
jgi:hypothetical protein